jgi:3'(2'), 5'-bisphosphate nucleotidase
LAHDAGRKILQIYRTGAWTVTNKSDESPVTQADMMSHSILVSGLHELTHELIISEEGDLPKDSPDLLRKESFWLIDPLDGTRDFIAKLDSFVVCVARIENNIPVFGLIHQPTTGETWWAEKGRGAFGPNDLRLMHPGRRSEGLLATGSRSHPSDRMQMFYDMFNVKEVQRFGSALKFCKLAEGDFDIYPRFGPTFEWDTAAGQIIAEEAGCKVIEINSQEPMKYGKPGLLNRGFIASRADLDIVGEMHRKQLVGRPS